MVVCRMILMVCKKKRSEIKKKTKWWKLKKEECCEELRQKLRQALGGQVVLPDDWETTAGVIRETGKKVLGVSSGRRKEDKETWWWNEEVQDSIQRKMLAKKKWDMDRTEENRQEYKDIQRRVKREVSKAKQKAYDELYTRLDTREGEKDLYRLARQRDRDGKDRQQSDHSPLNINGSNVEIVKSTKFLGVDLAEDFTWSLNISSITKKAQQRLYFLLRLRTASSTSHPDHLLQRDHRGHPEQLHHSLRSGIAPCWTARPCSG
ncbi:hypothetical protein QTP86_007811 [Hemibagrus guttatus]|nr:hypothetical protein QTP86_007811 [Hemibagrus guttatus]